MIEIPRHLWRLEVKRWKLLADPLADVAAFRRATEIEHRVAFAREAFIQLHDRPLQPRQAPLQRGKRLRHVLGIAQVLRSIRQFDPRLPKDLPRTTLRAELNQIRVASIERNVERKRQPALERRHVEARHVRPRGIGDRLPDPLEQPRPCEQLLAQRHRGAVVAAEQLQAPPRMLRGNAGQHVQVIVDDRLGNRLARQEDHLGSRQA